MSQRTLEILMTLNFDKIFNLHIFNVLSAFKVCIVVPYHPKKNQCKKDDIVQIKGLFIK
jgi:hypothetical protein